MQKYTAPVKTASHLPPVPPADLDTNTNMSGKCPLKPLQPFQSYKSNTLKKRAVRKFISSATSLKLVREAEKNEDPGFVKKSWRTWHCNENLTRVSEGKYEGKFLSNRCENRFCFICNSRKIVERYQSVKTDIEKYNCKSLLTLTLPNIPAGQLRNEIDKMFQFFENSGLRKDPEYKEIRFIRSLEVTYNKNTDTYHPHFHLLIVGNNWQKLNNQCQSIIDYWIKYFPEAHNSGQDFSDLRKSAFEVIKYLSKVVNLEGEQLYTIYKATENRRIFQVKGIKRETVTSEIEEVITAEEIDGIIEQEILDKSEQFTYLMVLNDWINTKTGEALTGIPKLPTKFKTRLRIDELINESGSLIFEEVPEMVPDIWNPVFKRYSPPVRKKNSP